MLGAVTPPTARPSVVRAVGVFLLPYLLLGLFWVVSNPPTAAPDENDHLVKALALAHLDIGVPAPPAPPGTTDLGQVRNASITRIVEIPARLSPDAYPCFRFLPRTTAACQPASPPVPEGTLDVATTLGAYPPFLYPPVGLVASLGADVPTATLLGRLVVLALSLVLLGLGCAHLVRWLGVRSLVGVAVAVTPMAVFCLGSLTTSAVEILGALGVATVVTVYARHPASLREPRTLAVVLVCGTALVLSRQLGVVSLGVFTLLLLALGGWREILDGLRERSRMMWATVVVPLVAAAAVALWEAGYDHPVLLGPWVSGDSLDRFVRTLAVSLVDEAVGQFGWLDVRPPTAVNMVWFAAAVALVGAALVRGDRRDRVVLVGTARRRGRRQLRHLLPGVLRGRRRPAGPAHPADPLARAGLGRRPARRAGVRPGSGGPGSVCWPSRSRWSSSWGSTSTPSGMPWASTRGSAGWAGCGSCRRRSGHPRWAGRSGPWRASPRRCCWAPPGGGFWQGRPSGR